MARFTHDVQMRWSDMDAYRHINNTVYLTYLEQARVEMFFHLREGYAGGTVVARHEIDYVKPIVFRNDPLQVQVWVGEVGAVSFNVHYEIFHRGALSARAVTKCVPFDFENNRLRRLTPDEKILLKDFADDAA